MIRFMLLALTLCVTSCARYGWVYIADPPKQGLQAQFGMDKSECLAKAYQAIPQPQISIQSVEQTQNVSINSGGSIPIDRRGASDVQESLEKQKAMRAQTEAIESAKRARNEYFASCMQSRGWAWQKVSE